MADTEAAVVLAARDARGVVTLTLNRPRVMNALSEAMLATLKAELAAIASDPSVRVVVIGGAGKDDDWLNTYVEGLSPEQRQAALDAVQRWPGG